MASDVDMNTVIESSNGYIMTTSQGTPNTESETRMIISDDTYEIPANMTAAGGEPFQIIMPDSGMQILSTVAGNAASPSRGLLLKARKKALQKNKMFEMRRFQLTSLQKKELCQYKVEHPKAYARDIALHFKSKWSRMVAPSTVSKILSAMDRWLNVVDNVSVKSRIYHPRHRRLEAALYLWYMNFKDSMKITNNMLRDKAHEIASELNLARFQCSKKWMHSFKKRHDILKFKHKTRPDVKILSIDLDYAFDVEETEEVPTKNKVTYYEELTEGTIHVTAPINFDESREGLMCSMGYLAAHPSIARNYIDLLWDVFQVITNNPQAGTQEETYDLALAAADEQAKADLKSQSDDKMDYTQEPDNTASVSQVGRHSETELSVAELMGATLQHPPPQKEAPAEAEDTDSKAAVAGITEQLEEYQIPENTLSLGAESGQIQYAVQGANGDYVLILAESENQGQDLDLTTILTAAGHTPVEGTRVIQTIDPVTGLRTITMDDKQPVPTEKTVIEVINSQTQEPDGIQDSTVTTATSLPSDQMYITKTEDDDAMQSGMLQGMSRPTKSSKIVTPLKMTVGDQVYDLMPIDSSEEADNSMVTKDEEPSPVMPVVMGGEDEVKLLPASDPVSEASDDGVGGEEVGELTLMKELGSIDKKLKRNSTFKSPITDCVVKIRRLPQKLTDSPLYKKVLSPVSKKGSSSPKKVDSPRVERKSDVHVCSDCDKVFTNSVGLNLHMKSHKKKKQPKPVILPYSETSRGYQCNVCDKYFTRHTSYKSHMLHHTGECPCFACSQENIGSPSSKNSPSAKTPAKGSQAVKPSPLATTPQQTSDEPEDVKPHVCQECGRCFRRVCDLVCHMKAHQSTGVVSKPQYECSTCGEEFRRHRELFRHMKKTHDNAEESPSVVSKPQHECSTCGEEFRRHRDLLKHMKTHEDTEEEEEEEENEEDVVSERECKICERVYSNVYNFRKHMKLHHPDIQEFECMQCDERFLTKVDLGNHKKTHQSQTLSNDCKVCGKEFLLQRNLDKHMQLRHSKRGQKTKPMDPKAHRCRRCDKTFVLERNLKVHQSLCHGSGIKKLDSKKQIDQNPHKCNRCDRSFALARNLQIHKKTKHNITTSAAASGKAKMSSGKATVSSGNPYRCNRCPMTFVLPRNLTAHKFRCPNKGPRTAAKAPKAEEQNRCLTCDKVFADLETFKAHIKTHIEEQLYKCPVCEMLFKNAEDIKEHVLVHTGEKPSPKLASTPKPANMPKVNTPKSETPKSASTPKAYTCTTCGQVFTDLKTMQGHMMSHEDDDSEIFHECHLCGKHLNSARNLKRHVLTHNVQRPVTACPVCKMEFQHSYHMKRHCRNAHPEHPI